MDDNRSTLYEKGGKTEKVSVKDSRRKVVKMKIPKAFGIWTLGENYSDKEIIPKEQPSSSLTNGIQQPTIHYAKLKTEKKEASLRSLSSFLTLPLKSTLLLPLRFTLDFNPSPANTA